MYTVGGFIDQCHNHSFEINICNESLAVNEQSCLNNNLNRTLSLFMYLYPHSLHHMSRVQGVLE